MVKFLDLDDGRLDAGLLAKWIRENHEVFVRAQGKVFGRIDPADDDDAALEEWARQPEQLARGARARERMKRGEGISLEEFKSQPPASD